MLVPVQPSPLDLWATKPVIEEATRERCRTLIVLTRVPARARPGRALSTTRQDYVTVSDGMAAVGGALAAGDRYSFQCCKYLFFNA